MTLLDALTRANALRTLDHALARSLRRLDPATPDNVLAAAALASLAVANGHAGFDLASPRTLVDTPDIPWPDADAWRRALKASRWVAVPADGAAISHPDRPLVLQRASGAPGLLYLRRYPGSELRVPTGPPPIARPTAGARRRFWCAGPAVPAPLSRVRAARRHGPATHCRIDLGPGRRRPGHRRSRHRQDHHHRAHAGDARRTIARRRPQGPAHRL